MQLRPLVLLATAAVGSSFLFQMPRTMQPSRLGAKAPLTRVGVMVSEKGREGVPLPQPTKNAKGAAKLFVFLWIDHLGNRVYKATDTIGTTPRRMKLWNPLVADEEQNYPEAGTASAPTFTKFQDLTEESLDAWVEGSFGELDDVVDSPVAYTMGDEVAVSAGSAAAAADAAAGEVDWTEEIEARYKAYNDYYPPATFEAMIKAMESSWRTVILSRGKQGAKAMREFYRDMHHKYPEVEEKVWVMETHATASPVPGDVDTYNHWMSDDDILKMACVATEGHDNVVEFSGLEFDDVVDGIKGEDWVTIPPPLSWFSDEKQSA